MTSTSIFQGSLTGKPSSRVLAPPGGGSSNIFGGPEEPPKKPVARPASNSEAPPAVPPPTQAPEPVAVPEAGEPAATVVAEACDEVKAEQPICNKPLQDGSGEAVAAPPAAVAPAVPTASAPTPAATTTNAAAVDQTRKKRMGYNPITGESYEIAENNVKTSISVRQPPGGASSGLW